MGEFAKGSVGFGNQLQVGPTVINQTNEGLFVYSGTPATGNLLLAIAAVAGTDAFGNVYKKGLTISNSGIIDSINGNEFLLISSTAPAINFNPNTATFDHDGFLQCFEQPAGTGEVFLQTPYHTSSSGKPSRIFMASGDSGTASQFSCSADNFQVDGNLTVLGIGQRQTVIAAADTTVTNSTTLVNADGLSANLVTGGQYIARLVAHYTAVLGNDIDFAWTAPAGSTGKRGAISPDITSAAGNVIVVNDRVTTSFTTRFSAGGSGGTFRTHREDISITAGATGTLQLQFAERVAAAATSAVVLKDSFLTVERVA